MEEEESAADDNEIVAGMLSTSAVIVTGKVEIYTLVLSSMRRELSSLEDSISHSTQAAPYTHACQNRLHFAERQRGMFRPHLGRENTQWTSCNFRPVPQLPGLDEWHTTTKSGMTAAFHILTLLILEKTLRTPSQSMIMQQTTPQSMQKSPVVTTPHQKKSGRCSIWHI